MNRYIKINDNIIHYIHVKSKNLYNLPLVLLHGFTGCSEEWFLFKNYLKDYDLIIPDLPGHYLTSCPQNVDFYGVESLNIIMTSLLTDLKLEKVNILGYSMGGRAALSFAIHNNKFVNKIILESSTAGIPDESQRKLRIKHDNELSSKILNGSIQDFINYWMDIPLFDSQKKHKNLTKELKNFKLLSNKTGLAYSLLGFGTGSMPDYFPVLPTIKNNVLLITGELDEKFTQINRCIKNLIPNSLHKIIENTGHNVHIENPQLFFSIVNDFLRN